MMDKDKIIKNIYDICRDACKDYIGKPTTDVMMNNLKNAIHDGLTNTKKNLHHDHSEFVIDFTLEQDPKDERIVNIISQHWYTSFLLLFIESIKKDT